MIHSPSKYFWCCRHHCIILINAIFFLLWLSVYEGVKSFYKEEDEIAPVNVYGKSKVAAEKFIYEKCSNFAILRSSIIYGPQTISPVPKSLPIQVCFCNCVKKFLLICCTFVKLADALCSSSWE